MTGVAYTIPWGFFHLIEGHAMDSAVRRDLGISVINHACLDSASCQVIMCPGEPGESRQPVDPWLLIPTLTRNARRRTRYGVTITRNP